MLLLFLSHCLLSAFLQAATPNQPPANVTPTVQAAAPPLADSPLPTDAKQLLDLARKVNGLTGSDVQPWHLKATFEIFDDDGKSKDKGTYEEWWVRDKQYKRVYQSAEFSQVEYGTKDGPLRSGDPKWVSVPVAFVRSELVDPLPSLNQVENSNPTSMERTFAATKLRCVYMTPKVQPRGDISRILFPSYCFNLEKPILRSSSTFNNLFEILSNRMLLFRGRYLGGDIDVTKLGKNYLKIHVDLVEPLSQPSATDFQPPPDAVAPPPRRINISGGVAEQNILTKVNPEYPVGAVANRIQGTVVIQATISEKGRIRSLNVISGPPDLQAAALDAVRQWEYKPYLLNGEPVEVQTTINVVFSLNGH